MELPKVLIAVSTENKEYIETLIAQEDRLNELVELIAIGGSPFHLRIENGQIEVLPDWADNNFPILIESQPFEESLFMALVFFKLGNFERALQFLTEDHKLFSLFYIYALIQSGYDVQQQEIVPFWEKLDTFNQCLFLHNLNLYQSFEEQFRRYSDCISVLGDNVSKYYLIHHQYQLIIDHIGNDIELKMEFNYGTIPEPFNALLKFDEAMLQYTSVKSSNDLNSISAIETAFKSFSSLCLNYGEELRASIVLIDLAELQLLDAKYEDALRSINASLLSLKKFDLPYFLARASVLKGRILYGWSKNGAPQYYKSSINAYQNALKVFTPSEYPLECAEIKGNLALLYTDMTSSDKEQPMWYALSASCFKEAIELFEKSNDTISLSEVTHNYATALMNFPDAKLNDHLAKAKELFELALIHRPAALFPLKRVMTLLNYLELQLKLHNNNENEERTRLKEMELITEEIKGLTTEKHLLDKVEEYSKMINNLKELI